MYQNFAGKLREKLREVLPPPFARPRFSETPSARTLVMLRRNPTLPVCTDWKARRHNVKTVKAKLRQV